MLKFTPLTSDAGYQGLPAWSPIGQAIAYSAEVNGRLQIFTRKMPSGETRQITTAGDDCTHPFWSEDGLRVFFISMAHDEYGLWSVSADGAGKARLVVDNAFRAALSPNGRTLAFLRNATRTDVIGTASLWLATPETEPPWSADIVNAFAKPYGGFAGQEFVDGTLAFSPDGHKLGLIVVPDLRNRSDIWQFWIVPMQGGEPYQRLEHWNAPAPRLSSLTWQQDNRHVVIGATELGAGSQLWLADLDKNQVWPITRSSESQSYPSMSPDGHQLAYVSGEPEYNLHEIDLERLTQARILETTRNESDAVYTRDGGLAYVTDRGGAEEIWTHSPGGRESGDPVIDQSDFGADATLMLAAPSFSRQGVVAFLRNGYKPRGVLRVWLAQPGEAQPTPLLRITPDSLHGAPTWSPDAQWIAFPMWKDNAWRLVKARVGSPELEPTIVRSNGTANAMPKWSPDARWISWEDNDGFLVLSPETGQELRFEQDEKKPWSSSWWLAHAWTPDSTRILGIQRTSDRELVLAEANIATRRVRHLMTLQGSVPVNNPVKGFDVSPDGRRAVTAIAKMSGHVWLIENLHLVRKP